MPENTQPADVKTALPVPETAQTSQSAPAKPAPTQTVPPKSTTFPAQTPADGGPPRFEELDIQKDITMLAVMTICCGVIAIPFCIWDYFSIKERKKQHLEEYEAQLAHYHEQQRLQAQMQSAHLYQQQPGQFAHPNQIVETLPVESHQWPENAPPTYPAQQ